MKCPECENNMDQISYFNVEAKIYNIEITCDKCEVAYTGLLERVSLHGEKAEQVLCDSDLSVSC